MPYRLSHQGSLFNTIMKSNTFETVLSCVGLFVTPWTVALQVPLSMGFPRQEYWSGVPFPPPGDLPDPGIEPMSLVSPAFAGMFFTTVPPGKPHKSILYC